MRAAETELIRRLEAEWQVLAPSRWLRDRLETWASEDDEAPLIRAGPHFLLNPACYRVDCRATRSKSRSGSALALQQRTRTQRTIP